jgi:hypothetical protein
MVGRNNRSRSRLGSGWLGHPDTGRHLVREDSAQLASRVAVHVAFACTVTSLPSVRDDNWWVKKTLSACFSSNVWKKKQHTLHVQEISTREKGGAWDVRMQACPLCSCSVSISQGCTALHTWEPRMCQICKNPDVWSVQSLCNWFEYGERNFARLKTLRDTQRLPSKVFLQEFCTD